MYLTALQALDGILLWHSAPGKWSAACAPPQSSPLCSTFAVVGDLGVATAAAQGWLQLA
jgi:hypothetical protein